MLSLWNLYLLLPLSLPFLLHVTVLTGENVKETQQPDTDTAVQRLSQPSQRRHGSGLTAASPMLATENVDFLSLSWHLSSPEESDSQGVIGEYTDLQEGTETSPLHPHEKGPTYSAQPIKSSSGGVPPPPAQDQQTLKYQPGETSTGSLLQSTQTGEIQPSFPAKQNETTDSQLPFILPGSLPSEQDSTSLLFAGPGPSPEHPTPPVSTGRLGWTSDPPVITQGKTQEGIAPVKETGGELIDITDHILHRGAVRIEEDKDDSKDDELHVLKTSGTLLLDGNIDSSATTCKTSNQSWTPTYSDDLTPNESLHPSLALSPALFVPLYSDWNSALATWGFAWEAHIYGLGSVFTVFGLISVVCLLGLPLRCPPGIPYLTLLHLFLLAFAGIQAFRLLYDAYNHQDRLPPLGSLLLSELPFPCLISAFSLAILLLSLRSRMRLSLPLANSTSFSVLPKPCLLLCLSLFHSAASLGCVGMLQLFHSLPTIILLFPQGVFVCLTIFLSCSYLIFYCLIQVDTKHIYRLNDNGESGGSPEIMQPTSCPFSKAEDWGRAAGAGVGASLCLLGCGGLQLYGILHALGLGGVDGYGFQPWPWWGYQVGCRLCEVGVCLGLSLIGTHPLFCHNSSSIKTLAHPRPGSWSRLSCSSPSRGITMPSQGGANSPVLASRDSRSQGNQEKQVVCDIISKGQSEALPLFSMVDSPGNGLGCVRKTSKARKTVLTLPTPPSPPHKPKNAAESQLSSLDSIRVETDSTVDLRPPSPINLSLSIDQALFSESLFSHSIFGLPGPFHASSSLSLSSPCQEMLKQGPSCVENVLYRTSSCGDVDQENTLSSSRPSQPHGSSQSKTPMSPEQWDWKGSISGSTQGLCSNPKETGKLRSHSWANRGQNFTQSSLPRAIPHLSYHRRYRTLSLASQDSHGSGRLAGTKHLSESKQLEWDLAVQAEFVNVCKQIDALSVCSDTIEL
ncbi:proline-rich transmembrane protein 4 [Larimichthys crocea]|uniref:proline-rich transmembrane protein 4 n=1 Tax=Larimichthys crocea TaxID=215358 RepID=UPI000622E7B1|nr:proline-rich transmembrane protein 4 [Larimichthys crocea]XP_019115547.1 proline-rich transmembrane protein 4 [Larimichthys crocea]XP_019115548.1 proline-rich transmembrane protein 4 [Larimichthys crocea]